MRSAAEKLGQLLLKSNLTLAMAESISCGCASNDLGNVEGTSLFFKGSIVCYNEEVKTELIGISKTLLKTHSAESQQVTDALALKLKKLIDADIHAAVTGLAAPGGSETAEKPVGTVFISVLNKGKLYKMQRRFYGSPQEIKEKACKTLFQFIYKCVKSTL
jgi:PncC family amidohydrolase